MKARKSLSMFSATISREVMDIGWMYQKDAEEITVQPKEESQPKITQYMLETSGRNKLSDLAQIIIGEGYKRVMVFCDTKFNTATLANQLARLGFSVDCLHGDLSQKERNQIMQAFRDGKLAILVATDVAARGIDVSDVDAVINYDVPSENEHYTHRIGRTGRAKEGGRELSVLCAGGKEAGAGAAAPDPQHRPVHPGALRLQPRAHRGGEKAGQRRPVPDQVLFLKEGAAVQFCVAALFAKRLDLPLCGRCRILP